MRVCVDGSYAPVILRLAWHASGTYDKDSDAGGRSALALSYRSLFVD